MRRSGFGAQRVPIPANAEVGLHRVHDVHVRREDDRRATTGALPDAGHIPDRVHPDGEPLTLELRLHIRAAGLLPGRLPDHLRDPDPLLDLLRELPVEMAEGGRDIGAP